MDTPKIIISAELTFDAYFNNFCRKCNLIINTDSGSILGQSLNKYEYLIIVQIIFPIELQFIKRFEEEAVRASLKISQNYFTFVLIHSPK